jgi:hypothetical protein
VLCGPLLARSTRYRSGQSEQVAEINLKWEYYTEAGDKWEQYSKHVTFRQLKAWWDDDSWKNVSEIWLVAKDYLVLGKFSLSDATLTSMTSGKGLQ